jgi:succinoglycan biosynthesis protein ExoU
VPATTPKRAQGVAVIIAAYDAAATIERAVRSALDQPAAEEIIIVDDGSHDGTAELARGLQDGRARIQVISQRQAGPSAARNLGISLSRSQWICPLDADDFMLSGRLAKLLAQADGCDLVADDILMVDEGSESAPPTRLLGEQVVVPLSLDFHTLVDANVTRPGRARREFGYLKPLIRREFLTKAALAYDPRLRLGEDFVLYARALAAGANFKIVEPCGYVAVQRPNSLSHEHATTDLRSLRAAASELARLPSLSPQDLAALRRLDQHLGAKIDYREVLDAKKAGGLFRGLAAMALRYRSAPYILRQTVDFRIHRALRTAASP